MALVLQKMYNGYTWLFDDIVDSRTKDWFLVRSPFQLAAIIGLYLYFCLKAGPQFMESRKPFDVKRIMQAYNLFQVGLSVYILYVGTVGWYLESYSLKCQVVTYGEPGGMIIARGVWIYFINKIVELLDTVFFILRKKYKQVSFLHLYHHTLMPMVSFIGVTWLPGGPAVLVGMLNTFVHVIMYFYYFLASLGPEWQKYLWWKKHLTALQLVQFIIIFVQNFQVLFRECSYPKVFNCLAILESSVFIYLFGQFYVKKYLSKPGDHKEKSRSNKKVE